MEQNLIQPTKRGFYERTHAWLKQHRKALVVAALVIWLILIPGLSYVIHLLEVNALH